MSLHEYKGCAIRVVVTDGRRPFSVEVDGARLMGKGERVQRQLAYSTSAAAVSAGKRYVLGRIKQCAAAGHHLPHEGKCLLCKQPVPGAAVFEGHTTSITQNGPGRYLRLRAGKEPS